MRAFFEGLWIVSLFGGLIVMLVAGCTTLPTIEGEVVIEFCEICEEHREEANEKSKEEE